LEFVLVLAVLGIAVFLIAGPLRAHRAAADPRRAAERSELEAAQEAKYREIRDAELDFRTGKVSEADYRITDRELREQAVAILREVDEHEAERR
jgi:flagellar biosynthesis/type III secretory pathway M-ring protein FliF/YscJ